MGGSDQTNVDYRNRSSSDSVERHPGYMKVWFFFRFAHSDSTSGWSLRQDNPPALEKPDGARRGSSAIKVSSAAATARTAVHLAL
jgi:hypothetical protein